jgi:hypothetical protein
MCTSNDLGFADFDGVGWSQAIVHTLSWPRPGHGRSLMGNAVINMGYEGGAIGVVLARPSLQVVGLRAFHTLTAWQMHVMLHMARRMPLAEYV